MDSVQDYADSEDTDDDFQTSSLKVVVAPDVQLLEEPLQTASSIAVQQNAAPSTNWNPAGTASYFAIDDASFRRQERSFGHTGVCEDPETHQQKKATTIYAAHPESRVHAKRALAAAPLSAATEVDAEGVSAIPAKQTAQKRARKDQQKPVAVLVPSSELHVAKDSDFLGRSWIVPSAGSRTFEELEEYTAYIPKRCIHESQLRTRAARRRCASSPITAICC